MEFDAAHLPEFVERLHTGAPVGFSGVDLYTCEIHGRRFVFSGDLRRDPIQRSHREGRFYEEEELAVIKSLFPLGGTFVDIGANIGNHSLFVASFLAAGRVIPFEPNPRALKLLLCNIASNGLCDQFDLRHLGQGVGTRTEERFGMEQRDRNLGAARMLPGEGDIRLITGDQALANDTPDFIKVDVEGMEIDVLSGLSETLARCRPSLLVEVDKENDPAFHRFIGENGYEIADVLQRYNRNKNYVIKPRQVGSD